VLPGPLPAEKRAALKRRLGIAGDAPVVTLGSARQGESEMLLAALEGPEAERAPVVILAPRHLENVPRVAAACAESGYDVTLSAAAGTESAARGGGGGGAPADEGGAGAHGAGGARRAVIVNEMGRLLEYYAISDIGVVGGTLKPYGGHNPLEPASQGAVVVVGPHRDNIGDDMDYLASRDAVVVTDGVRLGAVIRSILSDPAMMKGLAERAALAVEAGRGASLRCVEAMKARGLLG
jgi:3-deoxy-D-manno-octulosonic-acid transferase